MLNTEQRARFHALGREHPRASARTRLAWAATPEPEHLPWDDSGDRAKVERDGFTVVVKVEPDEDPTGEITWTDEDPSQRWGGTERIYRNPRAWDTSGRRDHGEYAYGDPSDGYSAHRDDLRRSGYSRHESHTLARRYVMEQITHESDEEWIPVVVMVHAYRDGVELAIDGLGGIDLGTGTPDELRGRLDQIIADHAMIPNIIEEARATLVELGTSTDVVRQAVAALRAEADSHEFNAGDHKKYGDSEVAETERKRGEELHALADELEGSSKA